MSEVGNDIFAVLDGVTGEFESVFSAKTIDLAKCYFYSNCKYGDKLFMLGKIIKGNIIPCKIFVTSSHEKIKEDIRKEKRDISSISNKYDTKEVIEKIFGGQDVTQRISEFNRKL